MKRDRAGSLQVDRQYAANVKFLLTVRPFPTIFVFLFLTCPYLGLTDDV